MGTVHLTNGHHGLYIRHNSVDLDMRVLLDEEMLARPIYNGEHLYTAPCQHAIRGALQALMELPGFNAAVSFGVVERDGIQHIAIPRRVWGEITLSPSNVVVGFSHDSRYENHPYSSLLQWLEEDYPSGELTDTEFEQFCLGWASPERWRRFFEHRIRMKVREIRRDASNLRQEAQALGNRSNLIESTLG
ncbi:MAG TPA: hypothetical protein VGB97_02355 [Candidatus Paceibacterota bacterium]|jgi:hypothetical protein